MLGQLGHSRAISAKGAGGRVSAKADRTADHLGDAIASALSSIADRFRGEPVRSTRQRLAPRQPSLAMMQCAGYRGRSSIDRLPRSQSRWAWEFWWVWPLIVVDCADVLKAKTRTRRD
jgi:hypothetical protein